MGVTLYTIGHSNHDQTILIDWLRSHGIQCLIDIRRHPGSRRLPQFNQGNLRRGLQAAGMRYHWQGDALGGMREVTPGINGYEGLAGEGLRGFAEYMNTNAFRAGLDDCLTLAAQMPTTIMCAERNPEHCHRQLISDYLVLRGHDMQHIIDVDKLSVHDVNPAARLDGEMIYYDRGSQTDLGL